ncbi:hypothetical protein [Natranaeroarchaeum sulfidigenes]|uniref:Putative membrane protein n=1 Tax=Natranaeroarchaeum sulfidigenes TaxID=2784880 RepID=A0A897MVZ4_9EURY|nr:hypothetical protein [Natranaeroarchaeum sulfidigenes]QSG04158.1 putative membrane protein [Natranaeroarchaeum sulfidigenes]
MSSTPDAERDDGGEGDGDHSLETTSYTHDPATFDEDGDRVDAEGDGGDEPTHPAAVDREFDWRGWVLIGVMALALVVAPLVVYLRPPVLPFWVSLVVMPLIPALLLGVVAVWATTRP